MLLASYIPLELFLLILAIFLVSEKKDFIWFR